MASFDIKAAKAAGYTDEEIAAHLATLPGFDVKGALAAGYTPKEVVQHIAEAKPEAYTRGRNEAGGVERGLLSVMQGPTFGFGDEIYGAVKGAYDTATKGGKFSQNYAANRDYARGAQDVESETNPWTTAITQTMASAPLMAFSKGQQVVSAAKEAPSMLARILRTAPAAATQGFVGGVGNSTADNVGDVLLDGAKGATVSTGLTAATIPASAAVSKVYKTGTAAASNGVKALENRFGVRTGLGDNFSQNADELARLKIAEALRRDATGEVFVSGQSNPINQAGANMRRLGPEATVTDGGGQNTKQLLDTLATLPGRTKQSVEDVIHARQAGRSNRLIDSAADNLGTQGQRLSPHIDMWTADREIAAGPLYKRVWATNVQPTDELRGLMSAADELGALNEARKIATANQTRFTVDPAYPQQWNLGQLDQVKQGLDKLIAKEWDAANGKYTTVGSAYINLKNKITSELDRMTTDGSGQSVYKAARDAFAGPSQVIDAANLGRLALSKDGAAISELKRNLESASEMQAFRLGAFEALRAKLGKEGGQTEIMKMWKEPATREKLKEVFGDEANFRKFAADVARESRLKGMESVGRGSQTAARHYGAGDLDEIASTAGDVAGAASGNPAGVFRAVTNTWNKVKTPEAVRDRMGQILLSREPQELDRINSTVSNYYARQNANNKRLALILSQQSANNPQWFDK